MMKRFLMLLFALLLLAGCNASGEKKQINIGYLRVPNDETIAKEKGWIEEYFNKHGMKTNFIVVDSGVEANKAFASGSIDFATMGNTNGIVALAQNLDVELVWIHEVLGSIEGLAVRSAKGIEKVEDLKGKKIATTFSSTSHYILLNVLKEAGIHEDVELLDMQTTDIVAAWDRGDIDAAYTWQPSLGAILEKGGKILIDSADMAKKGFITANVALVRKAFAKEHEELVAGLLLQLSKGSELYRKRPAEAAEIVAKGLEISKDLALQQMQGSLWLSLEEEISEKYLGSPEQAGDFSRIMHDTALFLEKQGSITKAPSKETFDQFINPSYAKKALTMGEE